MPVLSSSTSSQEQPGPRECAGDSNALELMGLSGPRLVERECAPLKAAEWPPVPFCLPSAHVHPACADSDPFASETSSEGARPFYIADLKGGRRVDIASVPNPGSMDGNLAHFGERPVCRRYLWLNEVFLEIPRAHRELRCICVSGTTAVWAAIQAADRYQRILGSPRRGPICSVGTHQSGLELDPERLTVMPLVNGQMDEAQLLRALREEPRSVLLLTVGRTDDGCIEALPEKVEKLCLELRIPVALDLSAGTIFPFLPDRQSYADDNAPELKRQYRRILESPAVKFVVSGWGKSISGFGLGSVFLTNDGEDAALCEAAAATFHLNGDSYFPTSGYFGGTTIPAAPAVEAINTMEHFGPWVLRLNALNAKRYAAEVAAELRARGRSVRPVNVNALVVDLESKEEVRQAQAAIFQKYRISVAAVTKCGYGLRVEFGLGRVFSPQDQLRLVEAIVDVVPARHPEIPEKRCLVLPRTRHMPGKYRVSDLMLYCLCAYYKDSAPRTKGHPTLEEYTERALDSLSMIQYQVGIDTRLLRKAFVLSLKDMKEGSRFKRGPQSARSYAEEFLKRMEAEPVPEADQRWQGRLVECAESLLKTIKNHGVFSKNSAAEALRLACLRVIGEARPLVMPWIKAARPLPCMLDL